MARYRVTFRDRSIELYEADRVTKSGTEVRLVDAEGDEVASFDEEEVHAIQKVDEEL